MKSKDALGEKKGQMFHIFGDAPILDRVGEIYFDKFDPILYEFSFFDDVKHDSYGYDNKWVI